MNGSSPRGRGTLTATADAQVEDWFIPAWAGNTQEKSLPKQMTTVHPRVGGEHPQPRPRGPHPCGSSPRGRGTPTRLLVPLLFRRFIPAWAGNTGLMGAGRSGRTVHPRVGGEHRLTGMIPLPTSGSSPRGRGTQLVRPVRHSDRRFIPAWAGNTGRSSGRPGRQTVHPRVGGEHE